MRKITQTLSFMMLMLAVAVLSSPAVYASHHEGSHGGPGSMSGKSCCLKQSGCDKCDKCSSSESLEDKFYKKVKYIKKYGEEAGISEAKIKEAKALKNEVKKMLIEKDAAVDMIKVDIKAGMYEYPVDLDAMNALIDEKYEIKKARAKELMAAYAKVKSIPSESQWDKIKELAY